MDALKVARLEAEKASLQHELSAAKEEASTGFSEVELEASKRELIQLKSNIEEQSAKHERELEQAQRDQDFLQDQMDHTTSSLRREVKELKAEREKRMGGGSNMEGSVRELRDLLETERGVHREALSAAAWGKRLVEEALKGSQAEVKVLMAKLEAQGKAVAMEAVLNEKGENPSLEKREIASLKAGKAALKEDLEASSRVNNSLRCEAELHAKEVSSLEFKVEDLSLEVKRLGFKLSQAEAQAETQAETKQANPIPVVVREPASLRSGLRRLHIEVSEMSKAQKSLREGAYHALRSASLGMGQFSASLSHCWVHQTRMSQRRVVDAQDSLKEELARHASPRGGTPQLYPGPSSPSPGPVTPLLLDAHEEATSSQANERLTIAPPVLPTHSMARESMSSSSPIPTSSIRMIFERSALEAAEQEFPAEEVLT